MSLALRDKILTVAPLLATKSYTQAGVPSAWGIRCTAALGPGIMNVLQSAAAGRPTCPPHGPAGYSRHQVDQSDIHGQLDDRVGLGEPTADHLVEIPG